MGYFRKKVLYLEAALRTNGGGDFFCGHIYPALVVAALMAAPVATW